MATSWAWNSSRRSSSKSPRAPSGNSFWRTPASEAASACTPEAVRDSRSGSARDPHPVNFMAATSSGRIAHHALKATSSQWSAGIMGWVSIFVETSPAP